MKKVLYICLLCCLLVWESNAQSYNTDRVAFVNYITRMYNNEPFEGVRIVKDYENVYLISVLSLDKNKYKTDAMRNRVASVKAMSEVSRFFNGSTISQETIIYTSQKDNGEIDSEWVETIRENSVGHVQSLEQLTNFTREDGMQVFVYCKKLETKKRK